MKNRTWKQEIKSMIPNKIDLLVVVPMMTIAWLINEYTPFMQDMNGWMKVGTVIVFSFLSSIVIYNINNDIAKSYDKGYDNGYADGEHDTQNLHKAD